MGAKIAIWFHLVTLILYMIICVAHYLFLSRLLLKTKTRFNIPFVSSILFCVHPIHSEVVSSVVGQADLLCTLVFFSAIISYRKAIVDKSFLFYCVTILLSAISMFFKETGITALVSF